MTFTNYVLFQHDLASHGIEYAAEHTLALGMDAVEFLAGVPSGLPAFNDLKEAEKTAEVLKRYGLKTSCFSVGASLYGPDMQKVEEGFKRYSEIAAILGSSYLHHTLFHPLVLPPNPPSYETVFNAVIDSVERVAAHAKQFGVSCLYEPQGMYFNGAGLKKLIDTFAKMGVENVGVCADFGNSMFVDYAPCEIISEMMQYVCHVHIKDYKLCPDGEGDYRSSGGQCFYEVEYAKGDMKNRECIKALLDAGYNGYFSTELNPRRVTADDAGVDALKRLRKDFL